ncbi:MAG: ABC transporter substrate-binding protein/permease [Clostridia bacterium]|nr:ABC transporter substrate-binding protein/permease [Clostridia bacterium]
MLKKLSVIALVMLMLLTCSIGIFADEAKEVLKVGITCDNLPFSWEQEADGNAKLVKINDSELYAYGYDVIIANRMANKLGYTLEIVKLDSNDFVNALEEGKVDAVMSGLVNNDENSEKVDFTVPFYYNNVVTLVKADGEYVSAASVSDLAGANVFVAAEYIDCLASIPDANAIEYDDMSAMLEAIVSNECNAAIVNRSYAKAALTTYTELAMLDFYGTDGDYSVPAEQVEICMAVKKGNAELLEALNVELNKLSLGMNKEFTFKNFDSSMHTAITLNPDFIYAEPETASFIDNIVKLWNRFGITYLTGAGTTLLISVVGTFFGCVIGFLVGVVQTIPVDKKRDSLLKRALLNVVRAVMRAYVEIFRGTPMIVQAVFIYYGAQMMFDIKMDMWTAAFFIVSINTGAYMAETVRGGIMSIDIGQTEGAKAIGMTHVQTMMSVILPQTFRVIIPQIGNNFIINIKDTSVLSVISISDLFFSHKAAVGALYTYFESATIVMLIYLTMTMVTSVLLRKLEKKLGGDANYDVATTDTLALTSGTYNFPDKKKTKEDFR